MVRYSSDRRTSAPCAAVAHRIVAKKSARIAPSLYSLSPGAAPYSMTDIWTRFSSRIGGAGAGRGPLVRASPDRPLSAVRNRPDELWRRVSAIVSAHVSLDFLHNLMASRQMTPIKTPICAVMGRFRVDQRHRTAWRNRRILEEKVGVHIAGPAGRARRNAIARFPSLWALGGAVRACGGHRRRLVGSDHQPPQRSSYCPCFVIHSRASFCASAICSGVMRRRRCRGLLRRPRTPAPPPG